MKFGLLVLLLTVIAPVIGWEDAKKGVSKMAGDELITIWLSSIDRASQKGFVSLESLTALPDNVRGDTSLWSERFFTAEANPYHQTSGVNYSYHLSTADTPDLLRYEYEVKGLGLEVMESSSYTLIRVRPRVNLHDLKQEEKLNLIHQAAQRILNMQDEDHQWDFRFPEPIVDNSRFSTDPNADPIVMSSWVSRSDGGIHKGGLYFLLFKRIPDRAGYRDIQRWFDSAFRNR